MSDRLIWLAVLAWVTALSSGFWGWHAAANTPRESAAPAAEVRPPQGRWALSVYLHPHCPCGRTALVWGGSAADRAFDLEFVFVRPPGVPDGWERGESWDAAGGVPGAARRIDADGIEARRAGATASGYAVLADPAGHVVFRGGVDRRGGRDAVLAWVGGTAAPAAAPVFGCRLFGPAPPAARPGE